MNRNVESHFSTVPRSEIKRSVFDRSHSLKTSWNTGELIPILCEEILPGDTVKLNTSKVVRLQTLLTPMMDNLYCETFYFYCPNRILWKHWKEFCGENSESAWVPATTYSEPRVIAPEGGFAVGTIADYLGYPVNVDWTAEAELAPSALPLRAYARICNEWFRDQNVKDPLLIPDDDANQFGSNGDNYITDVANGGKPFIAAKYHDYFTSCLPQPQKGEAVGISFGSEYVPVCATADIVPSGISNYPLIMSGVGSISASGAFSGIGNAALPTGSASSGSIEVFKAADRTSANGLAPANLWAAFDGSQLAFNVNDLRLAFATQKYLERMALGGSRYTETLRSLFGVIAPDASLQRPEYLGGSRIPLNVSEVTNNAQTENEYLGDLGGMSSTADQHYDFTKSFTEHGWLIGVACVRYKHSYTQGCPRKFMRRNFLDYYQPLFANLGNMPVYTAEIYGDDETLSTKNFIFGYQEAWAEYRYSEDRCTSLMRPGVDESLAVWHLADDYSDYPTLSSEWIDESKINVDRVLAVSSAISNQIFGDFYFKIEHTRPMPMYSIPGLIDHF